MTGCSTTQTKTVYVEPECEVPAKPALSPPEWNELLLPFSHIPSAHEDWKTYDEALTELEEYEESLVNYTLELKALANEICNEEES